MTLLQRIENGEFSRSRYSTLIEKEKSSLEKRLDWARQRYWGSPKILNEITQRETSRFETKKRDYEEKAHWQELKTLSLFRKELLKEFETDHWDEVFLNHTPETELEVYYLYKKLSGFHVTISEIFAKLNRNQ